MLAKVHLGNTRRHRKPWALDQVAGRFGLTVELFQNNKRVKPRDWDHTKVVESTGMLITEHLVTDKLEGLRCAWNHLAKCTRKLEKLAKI